jgi:hypothetical protein
MSSGEASLVGNLVRDMRLSTMEHDAYRVQMPSGAVATVYDDGEVVTVIDPRLTGYVLRVEYNDAAVLAEVFAELTKEPGA